MQRLIKITIRALYLLPALSVLFIGNTEKNNGGNAFEFLKPEQAHADIPYAQSSYYSQQYYEASYGGATELPPTFGDCPDGDGDGDGGGCC